MLSGEGEPSDDAALDGEGGFSANRRFSNRAWYRTSYMPRTIRVTAFSALLVLGCAVCAAIFSSTPSPLRVSTPSDSAHAVVATVGTRTITLRELEQAAALPLYQADRQRDTILRSALQDMIDEELLRTAASRQGISEAQLLANASQSPDIARLANLPDPATRLQASATRDGTRDAPMERQEPSKIRRALLVALRRQTPIEVRLPKLEPPVVSVNIDDDPSLGAADAPITIVEFSDFQCPYCKLSAPVIRELMRQYPGQLKVVYRDYPGPNHPYAAQAAEAAQCAGDQHSFWEYHDLLFDRQVPGSGWNFRALADELQLDSAAFAACLQSGRYREEVKLDLRDALKLGISSTPTFFVNGRPLVGARPIADFQALIESSLPH